MCPGIQIGAALLLKHVALLLQNAWSSMVLSKYSRSFPTCDGIQASGKSRGFALLRFADPLNAAAAVTALHGAEFAGRSLEVRFDRPLEERAVDPKMRQATGPKRGQLPKLPLPNPAVQGRVPGVVGGGGGGGRGGGRSGAATQAEPAPTKTLFVNNLNWNSTDDDLFQHFCTAGVTAKSAKVQMSETNGRSKGWGLVQYNSVEEAERARNQLNKTILDERKISVRFDAKEN
jgi:RNA recognition motif-containing protein